MPTYVYACKNCEHRFEIFQSFSAKAIRKCPDCGEKQLVKVIFPAGVVFKGAGFYVNDSKSGSEDSSTVKAAANSDGSEEKSTAKDSDAAESRSSSSTADSGSTESKDSGTTKKTSTPKKKAETSKAE